MSDVGTLMWAAHLTGDKGVAGISASLGYKIIAKSNTNYLFRITKFGVGTGILDSNFFWFEL